jgi:ATP-dependent DNA helicase RecG
VGVSDKGKVIGVGKEDEEKIGNIAHSCDPPIRPKIKRELIDGKEVLVVKVKKDGKIHSYKNVVYVRVGSSNKPLSMQEVLELGQKLGKIRFDEQICESASLKDINWDKLEWFKSAYKSVTGKEILTENKKLLENLGCIKEGKITNAGILLFGKNPERFIPQNQITIVRYPEDSVSDKYADMRDFYGNLFDLIDRVDDYIKEHIQIASRLIPGQIPREEIPQYPLFAVRELIVNAVAHRDYFVYGSRIIIKMFNDRIEYHSPGGFPSDITPKNIIDRQYSRNPILVKILNKVKYIEAIGDGIDRVFDSIKKHPLKPKLPLFREAGNSVIVTLYSADMGKLMEKELGIGLNERQKKGIEYIKREGRITSKIYRELFGIVKDTAHRDIIDLLNKGIISKRGSGKNTYYALSDEYRTNIGRKSV